MCLFMRSLSSEKQDFHAKSLLLSAPRSPQRVLLSRVIFSLLLGLLLCSGMLGTGGFAVPQAHAAVRPLAPPARATDTVGTFLAQHAPSLHPFVYPKEPPVSAWANELQKNTAKALPSSEPGHMAPLQQDIAPAMLTASPTASTTPLQMQGSDGRLTVRIPAGAIDASQATANKTLVASTVQAQGLHLTITQLSGISMGNVEALGRYQFQFSDAQRHPLSGVRLRHPITLQFHYDPADLHGLGLDPGSLLLTWPVEINQALAAKQTPGGLSTPMSNDAATHTLTAQTSVLGSIASVGTGAPTNQAPPKPLLATVQPNTGQLSYSYPITVAPGPMGTTPTVQLVY